VLFALDLGMGEGLLLAGMYAAAPVLASIGATLAATALVSLAAVACSVAIGFLHGGGFERQDAVLALTVAFVSNFAVWTAVLRSRVERAAFAAHTQEQRYRTLLRALSEAGEGLVVLEGERAVYANEAFERLTGVSAEDLLARPTVFELIEPDQRDEARRRTQRRVEDGAVDSDYRLRLLRPDGRRIDVEVAGVPLEAPEGPQLVVILRDISERVRAFRRSAFLAEASAVFDENLDESETLERIARVCVGDYASTCVIVLTEPGREPRRVVALARDAEHQALLDEHYGGGGARLDSQNPMVRVARSGEAQVEFAERLGMRASMLVPLAARGRSHGVMALGFEELRDEESARTLSLFEDVARRAALALDNARLYNERAHVARTLQRSLLPTELPDVPGVELAARYAAAGEGNEVGGDFYDCFAGLGDEWITVIGDVCGKGPEAAAITALTRYTLRTSVLHGGGPVEALQELNEVLLRQKLDHRFCTVLCAVLTPGPDGLHVRLASGGHPLPVVARSDGTAGPVGRPGTLLGVLPYPRLHEDELVLGIGESLVMYTDGVIEASPLDDAFGPERLADFVARMTGSSAGEIAAAIEAEAIRLQGGSARDDVAVLVARRLADSSLG
jgi:PAS domain S-box-containing protein